MIKRKNFEKGNLEKRKHLNREEHPVAKFLKKYLNYAINVEEITKKTKLKKNSIRSVLALLVKDGLVIHKAPYFAWKK